MAEIPGFDKAKLEEFAKFAAENPNDVTLGLEAKTIWEGSGVENLGKIGPWTMAGKRIDKPARDYSIQFGAWKEVEEAIGMPGAHDRIEPLEGALAALCSCVNTAIAINAVRQGLAFDGLEVTAKANVDPRVLFGIVPVAEAQSCIQSVDVDVKVIGDVSDADRQKILEMAERSPVHIMVSGPNTVNTTVSKG
jgi:uncharacterized OsmC-like protein